MEVLLTGIALMCLLNVLGNRQIRCEVEVEIGRGQLVSRAF